MTTPSHQVWQMSEHRKLVLDRPRLLAIVNMTPDSFYAGSRASNPREALALARAAVDAGADGLDIGGESTRPGAARVEESDQIDCIMPIRGRARVQAPLLIALSIS